MSTMRNAKLGAIALAIGLLGVAAMPWSVAADTQKAETGAPAETLRPEIQRPLVEAQALAEAKNYKDAIAKIAETDKVDSKTPYEIFAVERTRGEYYLKVDDKVNAAKSFEAVSAANYLKPADQVNLDLVIARIYFQASNYPATISWVQRYLKEGGGDPNSKDILNKAYFLNKEYAEAYKGFSAAVSETIAAGRAPDEQSLQIILNCTSLLNDTEGALRAVEQLNSYYPSTKNWVYLVGQVHSKAGFSERLYLDILRLKFELALMNTAADYVDMADTATRFGFPAEAKKVLDQGFASGVLDKGADARKNAALLDAANKRAADDLKTMQQGEASAAKSKDGTGLVNLGFAYATTGQFDKGASLIEEGISKGGLSRLEEAKLHLGIVYYWSGKKDKAIAQLRTVEGRDGTADLARYWIMQINHPIAK